MTFYFIYLFFFFNRAYYIFVLLIPKEFLCLQSKVIELWLIFHRCLLLENGGCIWKNDRAFCCCWDFSLRKHAYSNILKISPPKSESFQIKILIFFLISAQNIDCGYSLERPWRGGSNEYLRSMFLSSNQKKYCTCIPHLKPCLGYIKVGFKWVKIIKACFRDQR